MGKFLSIVTSKLSKLANNQKFREKLSQLTGGAIAAPKTGFVQSANTWIAQNPNKAQGIFAVALASVANFLPSFFSEEEIIDVAEVLEDGEFEIGIYTPAQKSQMDLVMGDRKSGYYGGDETEIQKNANIMANSLRKTKEIARLFGLHEEDVEKAVFLINSYEPADGEIYRSLGR